MSENKSRNATEPSKWELAFVTLAMVAPAVLYLEGVVFPPTMTGAFLALFIGVATGTTAIFLVKKGNDD